MLILAGVLVWVGAAKYFAKGSRYAVYFDESVQGLQVDSAIKYRGVAIGNVKRIGVAPDYRLIEVIMKINLGGDMANQTIASLKACLLYTSDAADALPCIDLRGRRST